MWMNEQGAVRKSKAAITALVVGLVLLGIILLGSLQGIKAKEWAADARAARTPQQMEHNAHVSDAAKSLMRCIEKTPDAPCTTEVKTLRRLLAVHAQDVDFHFPGMFDTYLAQDTIIVATDRCQRDMYEGNFFAFTLKGSDGENSSGLYEMGTHGRHADDYCVLPARTGLPSIARMTLQLLNATKDKSLWIANEVVVPQQ